MLISSIKNYIKNCNLYLFVSIWVFLSIYEYMILNYISKFDPGSNPKYTLLCNLTLLLYSLSWGILSKKRKIIFYLPTLTLPLIMSIMEFINFTINMRFDFYSQIYHYYLLCIAWYLFCSTIYALLYYYKYSTKFFVYFQNIIEMFCLCFMFSIIANAIFNGGINNDAVVAICQTNFNEAWHYFWGINHGMILILSISILSGLIFSFIYFCRKIPLRKMPLDIFPSPSNIFMMFFLAIFVFAIGWKANMYAYFKPMTYNTILHAKHYRNDVENFNRLIEERRQLTAQYVASHQSTHGVEGMFALIIGESLDRRYMGCYNPQHKTTPFQDELKTQSNTFLFPRIYACHVQTTKVIPMMLTAHNQYIQKTNDSFQESELSLSLFDFARSNGYKTYWISNQEKISNSNSIITSIALSADQTIFIRDEHSGKCFDHDILPYLEKISPPERAFIIIHLNGNHYPYGLSYPSDFNFPAGLEIYEKSVFYNDYVIHQLMDYFQTHGAIMVAYVSDHADAVSVGKGHDPRPNKFNREMIEIPMWFWFSNEYQQNHPNKLIQIQNCINKAITNDLVFNMFMDIMQLPISAESEKYSPLSLDYILDTVEPRTLGGQLIIPSP